MRQIVYVVCLSHKDAIDVTYWLNIMYGQLAEVTHIGSGWYVETWEKYAMKVPEHVYISFERMKEYQRAVSAGI